MTEVNTTSSAKSAISVAAWTYTDDGAGRVASYRDGNGVLQTYR